MRSAFFVLFVTGGLLSFPGSSLARTVLYQGPHPISPRYKKGMCWIQGPHVHVYRPHKPLLYVKEGKANVFVGDPVEFEEDEAPRHAYYGHHPVFWVKGDGHHYCYIPGPHYHWYAPPPGRKFKVNGGVAWWIGGHPSWYRPKHRRARALRRHYGRVEVARPRVTVAPPPGFVGVEVAGPGVEVKGPGVRVELKGPDVKVITPFGVVVDPGHRVKMRGHPRGHARGHYDWKVRGPRGKVHLKGHGMRGRRGHKVRSRGRVKGRPHHHHRGRVKGRHNRRHRPRSGRRHRRKGH